MNNPDLLTKTVHEAKGRFAFQLKRFRTALNRFEGLDIFEEEGLSWYKFFNSEYIKLEKEYANMKTQYNLSDQAYDFNSQIFEELNPI